MINQYTQQPTSPLRTTQPKLDTPQKKSAKDVEEGLLSTAITRRILQDEASSPKQNKYTGCNCSKSQCLKMYCACFSVGKMCDESCLCQSCKNDNDNMDRSEAINQIIVKDPHAFSRKNQLVEFIDCLCNCKKSACLKKYCDCYRRGKKCGESCQCMGCHNIDKEDEQERQRPTKMTKIE